MTTRKPKPRGRPFAPGNQAAAKPEGERTVARTYRLPPRTLAQIRAMVESGASASDVGAIRDCVDARAEALGIRVD
jgi:hypothetical protein